MYCNTETAVAQVLLSGVTQVCGHSCATPVALLWHTSVTFTCVLQEEYPLPVLTSGRQELII